MAESPWGGAHPEIPVSSYLSGILSAFSFSLGTIRPQFQVHSANCPSVLGSKLTKELIFFGQGGILELCLACVDVQTGLPSGGPRAIYYVWQGHYVLGT